VPRCVSVVANETHAARRDDGPTNESESTHYSIERAPRVTQEYPEGRGTTTTVDNIESRGVQGVLPRTLSLDHELQPFGPACDDPVHPEGCCGVIWVTECAGTMAIPTRTVSSASANSQQSTYE
jgi:hypothetical protein